MYTGIYEKEDCARLKLNVHTINQENGFELNTELWKFNMCVCNTKTKLKSFS